LKWLQISGIKGSYFTRSYRAITPAARLTEARAKPDLTKRKVRISALLERVSREMMRNAEGAARFFRLPPNRVVELGAQIEF